ncbi:MAG: hypothetical protein ABR498_07135 [Candidatus Dormibacteria bacterium]
MPVQMGTKEMLRRADRGDGITLGAALLGAIATYLPWYSYSSLATRVTVNGFRASILGDVFFLAVAAAALLVLMRLGGVADIVGGRISDRTARFVIAGIAMVAALLQLVLAASGGRAPGIGAILALIAAAALVGGAWLRSSEVEPRRTVREMLGEGLPD